MPRRIIDYKKVPPSSLRCPFCKDELNMKFDGFTCYGAVDGPYLKGRIALECADNKCMYRHSILFETYEGRTIHNVEKVFAKFVLRLPNLGPWLKLTIDDRGKRKARGTYTNDDAVTKKKTTKKPSA